MKIVVNLEFDSLEQYMEYQKHPLFTGQSEEAKPAGQAKKPAGQAKKPAGQAKKPAGQAKKSGADPVGDAPDVPDREAIKEVFKTFLKEKGMEAGKELLASHNVKMFDELLTDDAVAQFYASLVEAGFSK